MEDLLISVALVSANNALEFSVNIFHLNPTDVELLCKEREKVE